MKQLSEILYKTNLETVVGNTDITINAITFDSRTVEPKTLFIATKGTQVNGHAFIEKAIEKGASAILCEQLPDNFEHFPNVTFAKVKDSSFALGLAACNFYGNPSNTIKLVGVTGTNGKTTTATLLFNLFRKLGFSCGLLSTVQNQIDDTIIPSSHTTPNAIELNELLHKMVLQGCEYCFMEVSSHALVQNRVAGLNFVAGIFSNLTHDHLDYHETFENYRDAKKLLFDNLSKDAFAIVNIDDKNGKFMVQNTKAKTVTYAVNTIADVSCRILENSFDGLVLNIDNTEFHSPMIGAFNAYNIAAIYTTALCLGFSKLETLTQLSTLNSVSGRFQYLKTKRNVVGIVDYAHTPDALENVLKTINEIKEPFSNVFTVIGCGGNRDTTKRPIMAKIAEKYSFRAILTSDNPRNEEPEAILQDMKAGLENPFKAHIIVDRLEAIKIAFSLAQEGDVVLIAGKGHENYQEIKGVKHYFDDFKLLQSFNEN